MKYPNLFFETDENTHNNTNEKHLLTSTKLMYKKNVLPIIISFLFIIFSQSAFSQSAVTSDWILVSQSENVEAYYRIEKCGENNFLFLKFNNKGSSNVNISWVVEATQTGTETAPVPPGNLDILRSKEMVEGSCGNFAPHLSNLLSPNATIQKLALHFKVIPLGF